MTPEQQAAYIQSQAACMLAELAAMQAANQIRLANNEQPRFLFNDFAALPDKHGVSHNAVLSFFQQ